MLAFLSEGGIFMYILFGMSIFALAIILERFCALQFNYDYNEKFFSHIVSLVRRGEIRAAQSSCTSTSHPLAKIVNNLLNYSGQSRDSIESAASVLYQKVTPKVQRRTSYVSMIGNVATLVGLLGTIQGLIIAFKSLAGADAESKAALLAQGISTAMNTTGFGLVIGIPCVVAYTILTNKEEAILGKYEETIGEVIHILSQQEAQAKDDENNIGIHGKKQNYKTA